MQHIMKRLTACTLFTSVLLFSPVSTNATPMRCDSLTDCGYLATPQRATAEVPIMPDSYLIPKEIENTPEFIMSGKQQAKLVSLMESQATDRYRMKQTARYALIRLQQLATLEQYDELQASQLAQAYGSALAKLALLDVELASQIRAILTPLQQKAQLNATDQQQVIE